MSSATPFLLPGINAFFNALTDLARPSWVAIKPVAAGHYSAGGSAPGSGGRDSAVNAGSMAGPAAHEPFQRALKHLTPTESRALAALAEVRTFGKGAVIVGIGPSRRSLFLLTRGVACMVRSGLGQDAEIARFGAGDLAGEFSYLLRSAGQTLVYAVEPVEAQVIPEDALHVWLTAAPGLRERFYQSLAAHAAQRRVVPALVSATPAYADAALADWPGMDPAVTLDDLPEDLTSDGQVQSDGWRHPPHPLQSHPLE